MNIPNTGSQSCTTSGIFSFCVEHLNDKRNSETKILFCYQFFYGILLIKPSKKWLKNHKFMIEWCEQMLVVWNSQHLSVSLSREFKFMPIREGEQSQLYLVNILQPSHSTFAQENTSTFTFNICSWMYSNLHM